MLSLDRQSRRKDKILSTASKEEIRLEQARRSFSSFVKLMWPVVEPGEELIWAWYLDAICDHLQAITEGKIRKLIINMPPRFLKSTLVSVMWPAWEWIHYPHMRYLTSSYAIDLAERDSVRSREVMQSELYKKLIKGSFDMSVDQNLKSRYVNSKTGWRITTSPTSKSTGDGGNRVMCDDPHNVATAESDIIRQTNVTWWGRTMFSRANNPKRDAYVIVMQRVNFNDVTGDLLENQPDYEHLCLPMEYEVDHPHPSRTSLNFVDPRTEEGELLCPERFGTEEVAAAKKSLGSYAYAGQYQQRPAPAEGLIFHYDWFQMYSKTPKKFDHITGSWDLAFTGSDEYSSRSKAALAAVADPAHVVGQVWGFVGSKAYLLNEYRGKWGITNSIIQIKRMKQDYPSMGRILIEEKANGSAVLELLHDEIPGLHAVNPKDGKIQRAWAVLPYVEAGDVYLPDYYSWTEDWLEEVCVFPNRKDKDRVDAMTQVLVYELGGGCNRSLELLRAMNQW